MTQADQEAATHVRRPAHPASSPVGGAGARRAAPPAPGPRSARLLVHRIEPLSVLKFALVVALAAVVVALVFVAALYGLLDAMGVLSTLGTFTKDIGATKGTRFITFGTLLVWTALVSAIIAIFGAALATVGAFVYNLVNALVGGPEVTLTETI